MKMKLFALMCALTCAGAVQACDGVQSLGAGCYAQNVQRVVIEKQVQPQYQIVERIVEPVYVQRVEKVQRVVERQKVVVKRQRSARLRDAVQALTAPRAKVIRSERIVERSVY
jgi:alanine-alpha-ketoisovalerate/valine-pyruvate aminotransferase